MTLVRRRTVVKASVVVVALLLAGCGSSSSRVGAGSSASTAPAIIEVRAPSGTMAAINGTAERSIVVADGVALFDGLADGTYRVVVTADSPPVPERDGVDVGAARQIFNAGTYELHAGDHAVVTCDESTCAGVMKV